MLGSSVLITGATGFIGNALAHRLSHLGIDTTCLVRTTSDQTKLPKNIKLISLEAFTTDSVISALSGSSFNYIFHLGAYGVHPEKRDPVEMLKNNIDSTAALMLAAREWPIKRFVFTGTCAEYGVIADHVFAKESQTLKPSSLYGASKLAAGIYLKSLAEQFNLPVAILRLFGVYGPGEAAHRLIPYLIKLLEKNIRVDLSPGDQIRDFLFIEDVLDALLTAATKPIDSESYNVCSSQPISVREIALQVAKALGTDSQLLGFGERDYRPDEVMWLVGDNKLFTEKTSWRPTTSLEAGISRMITHYAETV